MNVVTSCSKRDFVDVIKLRILRWGDYPGLSGCAQCIQKDAYKRDTRGVREGDVIAQAEEQREIQRCYTAGFEDRGRSHEPRNAGGL